NVLENIVTHKLQEVAAAKIAIPLEGLKATLSNAPAPRDFLQSLKDHHPMGLIAEVKKASPSAGLIREDFNPVEIAKNYQANGAACISVLTDEQFFQGTLDYLVAVRSEVDIPVLRKDFIIDPYQVYEARAHGADCVLLIAECLDDQQLKDLYDLSASLGMQSLIELYEPDNLPRVLALNPPLIGINNRNLKTFKTDLSHTANLRKQIPDDIPYCWRKWNPHPR
ncbi:UNVERIFIED_CONTAM: hypothetical protein GTU68_014405, partial [Idotea baltica]|nr:hypothetical protein [Idotea baltica]